MVLIKILGYFEKIFLAYYWGTSHVIDVYTLVVSIILAVFFFFREVIEPGFLTVFLKALNRNDNRGAWSFFITFGLVVFILNVILLVVVLLFPNSVIDVLGPGFHSDDRFLANDLLRFTFPAAIFLSLSALTSIALNGIKVFVLPALGDLIVKLAMLFSLWILFRHFGIYSIVFGLVLGAIIKLTLHAIIIYHKCTLHRLKLSGMYLQDAWKLTWPLLIGVTFSQLGNLIDNIFASHMQSGAISALSYSKKVVELPIVIFPYILSVVIFPFFSELAIARNKDKLSEMFIQSIAWIIVVFFPLSVFFNFFSYEIVEVLLKRGAFNSYSTEITAYPVVMYSYGLVFFALETIVVVFYFANSNTQIPILVGMICVIENIIITYFLISSMGHGGIALAYTISKGTKVIILLYYLRIKKIVNFKQMPLFVFKVFTVTCVISVMFYFYKIAFEFVLYKGIINKFLFLFIAIFLGTLLYTALLYLIKLDKKKLFNIN